MYFCWQYIKIVKYLPYILNLCNWIFRQIQFKNYLISNILSGLIILFVGFNLETWCMYFYTRFRILVQSKSQYYGCLVLRLLLLDFSQKYVKLKQRKYEIYHVEVYTKLFIIQKYKKDFALVHIRSKFFQVKIKLISLIFFYTYIPD